MADIVAVLLIPADGDPGGLLADGLGESRPQVAVHRMSHQESVWQIGRADDAFDRALPLCWDGALVPEGYDRLLRSIGTDDAYDATRDATVEQLLGWARFAESRGLGRVVRLARVDGRLVEVGP